MYAYIANLQECAGVGGSEISNGRGETSVTGDGFKPWFLAFQVQHRFCAVFEMACVDGHGC